MYVCMYVCMYACLHVFMYVCMYVCNGCSAVGGALPDMYAQGPRAYISGNA